MSGGHDLGGSFGRPMFGLSAVSAAAKLFACACAEPALETRVVAAAHASAFTIMSKFMFLLDSLELVRQAMATCVHSDAAALAITC